MRALPLFLFAAALAAQTPLKDSGPALTPAVSADGRTLAFASSRDASGVTQLYLQPLEGGPARQLTRGPHDNYDPAFSPDARTLAYRSEANGGGIHLIPATGGKPKLLAREGRRPRYSPDGRSIAYSTGASHLFIHANGRARSLQSEFHTAKDPIWSPDGKSILFAGCKDAATCDWWITPAEGGAPTALGVAKHFTQLHFDGLPSPDLWLSAKTILFSAKVGENTRLWTLSLAGGPPKRLTTSDKDERTPALAPGGRIIYTSRTRNIDVWSLPINASAAKPKGALTRITTHPAIDQRPTLSRDGNHIAWETNRGRDFEVWAKDLASGKETQISKGPLREHMPALSPDGSKLVYDTHDGDKVTVLEASFAGGPPTRIREENIGQGSFQFTPDGQSVLYFHREPPGTVGLMNLATKSRTVLLRHPKLNLSLADARLSPDGQWIAFPVPFAPHRSRLAIARLNGKVIDDEKHWTYILPDTINSYQPEWSPNGDWLYFLSDQSGTLAVWALRLTQEKKPTGAPRLLLDLPGPRFSIAEMRPRDIGLAVAKDKLALGLAEYTGTLWTVQP